MTEQPLQRLDDWDDFVASRYREGKSEEKFRNYSAEANPGVAETARRLAALMLLGSQLDENYRAVMKAAHKW